MDLNPQILFADVMHRRLFPKENGFAYRVYQIAFDIERIGALEDGGWFGIDHWALASFHRKDHGACDGSSLSDWARGVIDRFGGELAVKRIVLVAMPRILGYGFNPVSFWLCLDSDESLRAVIAEVHNTFGERHTYFCRNENGGIIGRHSQIEAAKVFHVSPFLPRSGFYRFRFDLSEMRFGVWIDYHDENGKKQLLTSMSGVFAPNTRTARLSAFFRCPLVSLKTIAMIHWQAVKLFLKKTGYVPKPEQMSARESVSRKVTNS